MTPERIASTVRLADRRARRRRGRSCGSFAPRAVSASSEISTPGRDDAAEVLALGRDDVVVHRGAEVDRDARRRRARVVGGDRVHEPVGADLARVVDADRHPGPDARARPRASRGRGSARPSPPTRARAAAPSSRRSTRRGRAKPTPRSSSRLRSAAPSSSAVDSRTVAKRQCSTSSSPRRCRSASGCCRRRPRGASGRADYAGAPPRFRRSRRHPRSPRETGVARTCSTISSAVRSG